MSSNVAVGSKRVGGSGILPLLISSWPDRRSSRERTSEHCPTRDSKITARIATDTFAALSALLPAANEVRFHILEMAVEGGWVVAPGSGALTEPASELLQRNRFVARRYGSYITVDTGKYSTAPWLVKKLAEELVS